MADVEIGVGFDIPALRRSAEEVKTLAEEVLGRIGQGAGGRTMMDDQASRMFRDMQEALASLAQSADKFNQSWSQGAAVDKDRLTTAREIVKAHREMGTIQKAERIMVGGGPGTMEVGPRGGVPGGRGRRAETGGWGMGARFIGAAGGMVGAQTMAQTVGARGQMMSAALMAAGRFGPAVIVGELSKIAGTLTKQWEDVQEASLQAIQAGGGKDLAKIMAYQTGQGLSGPGYQFGMTPSESALLSAKVGRQVGKPFAGTVAAVGGIEAAFGLGGSAVGLLGAAERAGAGGTGVAGRQQAQQEVIGSAIGLAIAERLDKGRWGEAFENLSGAMQQSVRGQMDITQLLTREAFIGRMGPEYRGRTPARSQMQGVMASLGDYDQTGLAKLMQLEAAGYGKGKDYVQAEMEIARGVDKGGVYTSESLVRAYGERFRESWERNPDRTALMVGKMLGKNPYDVKKILEGYFKGEGFQPVDKQLRGPIESGLRDVEGALEPRRHKARQQARMLKGGAITKYFAQRDAWDILENVTTGAGVLMKEALNIARRHGAVSGKGISIQEEGLMRLGVGLDIAGGASSALDLSAAGVKAPRTTMEMPGVPGGPVGVGSFMGRRGEKKGQRPHSHAARDIMLPAGRSVYSPIDGTVVAVSKIGKGWAVLIEDKATKQRWRFLHLGKPEVVPGQDCPPGTFLGVVAQIRTPHLHLEIWKSKAERAAWKKEEAAREAVGQAGQEIAPGAIDPLAAMGTVGSPKWNLLTTGKKGDPAMDPATVPGSAREPVAPGAVGVNVQVTVQDKTKGGIDVDAEVEGNDRKSRVAPPGDNVTGGPGLADPWE